MLSINNTTTKSLTNVGGLQKLNLETDAKPNVAPKAKSCAVWTFNEGEKIKAPWKEGDVAIVYDQNGNRQVYQYHDGYLYNTYKEQEDKVINKALESDRGDIRK